MTGVRVGGKGCKLVYPRLGDVTSGQHLHKERRGRRVGSYRSICFDDDSEMKKNQGCRVVVFCGSKNASAFWKEGYQMVKPQSAE